MASRCAPTASGPGRRRRRRARVTGVTYLSDGVERFQRAAAVAVVRLLDRDPRLLLLSATAGWHGLGNRHDQVGRYLMVQGAPQVAARFPEPLRHVEGATPGDLLRAVLRDRSSRGFARGFSIQTVGPLPIAWAEHVLADGHWGQGLREYMRDYNHWTTLGLLCELLRRRRTGSRSPRRRTPTACAWPASTTRSATTIARTSRTESGSCKRSGRPPGRRTR